MRKDISVIIPAAGEGKRLGKTSTPKSFMLFKVNGKRIPLVLITLQRFLHLPEVREIIIAVHPRHLQRASKLIKNKVMEKRIKLIKGGKRRQDSVANALKIIDPKSRIILVHDAARPLVSPNLIRRIIRATRKYGAVLPALPVTDTVKRVNLHQNCVKETIKPRQELYISQTPQGFQREILIKAIRRSEALLSAAPKLWNSEGREWRRTAYRTRPGETTDEASLVESLGYPVKIVAGDPGNLKLTIPLDKIIIQKLLTSP